jgi:hypothetical protein
MTRAVRFGSVALVLVAGAGMARAQPPGDSAAVEGLPIATIRVFPREIYDPIPPGPLGPAYRLANRLHVRTRSSALRSQLLFAPGEPWRESAARETMRNLRLLDFLTPDRIEARRVGDSVEVEVETHDAWTTAPEFNLERGGGKVYGEVGLTEKNLFGLGKFLSFRYAEDPLGTVRGLSLYDPAVFRTRFRLAYDAEDGSTGAADRLRLGVPFYAEDTPYTYEARWTRATSVVSLFQRASVVADLDERLEETEVRWGRGVRVKGVVRRLTGSFLVGDRRLGPTRLDPGAPVEFQGGEENLRLRRVAAELRLWRPRFVERRRVNRLGPIEDIDLGDNLEFGFGVSPRLLGSTADETWLMMRGRTGFDTPAGFGWVEGAVETRARWAPLETLRQLDARFVSQNLPGQTLVASAYGRSGTRVSRDYQVVVGGLNGLRAYPVHAVAGRRLWRLNLEDRLMLRENWAEFITIGVAGFYDAARGWGAGSAGADWFHCAGVGLRVSFSRVTSEQVLRFDVAFPIEPTRDGAREAVFSFGSSQAF